MDKLIVNTGVMMNQNIVAQKEWMFIVIVIVLLVQNRTLPGLVDGK